MANYGGFYKGDKKKLKKAVLEKKAQILTGSRGGLILPKVEIISRGKKDKYQ
ncbi:hypothetical protein HYW54_05345 [Candidatus Gottesmanbacteria bacterium]|nr:hypothetical protein [Candidatus Gottesmanbacteria bacterium]